MQFPAVIADPQHPSEIDQHFDGLIAGRRLQARQACPDTAREPADTTPAQRRVEASAGIDEQIAHAGIGEAGVFSGRNTLKATPSKRARPS